VSAKHRPARWWRDREAECREWDEARAAAQAARAPGVVAWQTDDGIEIRLRIHPDHYFPSRLAALPEIA
jgi:hypothetical protein